MTIMSPVLRLAFCAFVLSACKPPNASQEEPSAADKPQMVIIYYKLPPAWIKPDNSTEHFTIEDLKKAGVEFGDGARLMTGGPTGFGMKNTFPNHEKLKALFNTRFGKDWHEYTAPD